MSVKITGLDEVRAKLRRLGDGMEKAVDLGVMLTANDVRTFAIKSIQSPSQGKVVTRYKQGGAPYNHLAAGEGQAPNTDTGALVKSIAVEKKDEAHYYVGTNLERGEWLEFGTSKMGERPWLYPALDSEKGNLIPNIEKIADIEIRKLTK